MCAYRDRGNAKEVQGFQGFASSGVGFWVLGVPSLPNSLTWDRLCWTFVRNRMANTVGGSLRQGACSGLFRIDG